MKKHLSILWLVTLMACTLHLDEVADDRGVEERLKAEANRRALLKRSHQFPFDSTAVLISNMLAIPALNRMAGAFAAGGTFPAHLFRVSSDSSGIILWYGFDPKTNEVFLSLEQLKNYDVYNLPTGPAGRTLIRPATFTNPAIKQVDRTSVRARLKSEVITTNEIREIDNTTLRRHMSSFDSLLSTMPDSKGVKHNQYLFSFFHNNRDGVFEKFLDQAGKNGYVRYYFGYDEHDVPNRIRVILVAVDAQGRNVTRINASGRTNGDEDAVTLQRSYPPPVN
jgi:hypothetical protein